MKEKFCQSCGMPMGEGDDLFGTNSDGSKSGDYCSYCYGNGEFKGDFTMDEMINLCVPNMVAANSGMTEDVARQQMNKFFPLLKRWK